jgi:membrane protease YdiL (CAAX protease family)
MYQIFGCVKGIKPMNIAERKKTTWAIVIFSILTLVTAFLAPLLGGSPRSMGPGFILWGAAPLLVALLMRLITRDWADAGLKLAIRKNLGAYLFALIACPVLVSISLMVGAIFSAASLAGFAWGPYLQMVLPGFAVFFLFAIFEEFGWRGYLAPKLAALEINPFLQYAITAAVWATWHLPYIRELSWVYSSEDMLTFLPRFYLYTFAYSILWNEIRLMTGSIWPVVLIHSLTNAIQHPLAADFLKVAPGMEDIFSFNGLFIIALTGLLGIAIHNIRIRNADLSKSLA